jgi:hypothetical protein
MESAKKVELIEALDTLGYDVTAFNEQGQYLAPGNTSATETMTLTIKPKAT